MTANQPKRIRKLPARDDTKKLLWPGIICLAVVILDQVTKLWAVGALADGESVPVLGRFFMFTLVYNFGGAMGTNLGSSSYYLVIAFILIPIVFYYMYLFRDTRSFCWSLAFIAGGAIGNIIDRVRLGKVIDFIDVDFFDIDLFGYHLNRWWTFNIADAAISCAIVFMVLSHFLTSKKPSPPVS